MLPNVFKTSKSIDFDKLMKEYILKNYGKSEFKYILFKIYPTFTLFKISFKFGI